MKISVRTCLAIDVLCSLAHNELFREDSTIKNIVKESCDNLNIPQSVWGLNKVLSDSIELHEIENLDLKGLTECYYKYTYKMDFINENKSSIMQALNNLMITSFEKNWKDECYPKLIKSCKIIRNELDKFDLISIQRDLEIIKKDTLDCVYVYLSYFTFPTSFNLRSNCFVTYNGIENEMQINDIVQLLIHELIHGFSDKDIINKYKNAYLTDEFLNQTHWFLCNCRGSFDEEEFVIALEYWIAVRNKLITKENALEKMKNFYGSCLPIAIILFDYLCSIDKMPQNINELISLCFDTNIVQVGKIREQVDNIIEGYSECFYNVWQDEKVQERYNSGSN